MEKEPFNLEAHVARSRSGPCFICEFLAGNPAYTHHLVLDDGETVVFLVNPFAEPRALSLTLSGGGKVASSTVNARASVLTGASPDDVNSFSDPQKISPHEEPVVVTNGAVHRTLPPYSLTVMRIPSRL